MTGKNKLAALTLCGFLMFNLSANAQFGTLKKIKDKTTEVVKGKEDPSGLFSNITDDPTADKKRSSAVSSLNKLTTLLDNKDYSRITAGRLIAETEEYLAEIIKLEPKVKSEKFYNKYTPLKEKVNLKEGELEELILAAEKEAEAKAIQEALDKIPKDLPNDGITSDMHEKYMSKIVFGQTMAAIEYQSEIESQFVTKANWGEEIRFRVYMDNSLLNYLKEKSLSETHGRYKIKYYLDGVEAGYSVFSEDEFSDDQKETFTTFKGALKTLGDKIATGEREFSYFLMKNESKFTPGEHQLKIEYLPYQSYPDEYEGPVVASGEITLVIKESLVDPNDEKVCLPKAGMNDNALKAKIVKSFNAQGWEEELKEVRILSTKWNIVRNQYTSIIVSRFVEAAVGSTKDGKCAYQTFNFYQDYDGNSYQSEIYLSGIGGKYKISCGCLE